MEIVFDNGQGRFPTGKEETRIRRTVGMKRDEFQVDGKPVSRGDVENLLQSAGFSRANPYYIVPQGRVTALCNATDQQRLNLLKEVAGTKVYEEHRLESVKILEETRMKREKIGELLGFIGERLTELEGEKGELQEFEAVDKQRRALEMTLYQRELQEYKTQLEELDVPEEHDARQKEVKALLERITQLEEQLVLENATLGSLNEQVQVLREEAEERKQAQLEHDFAAQQNEETVRVIGKLEAELADVERDIVEREDRMAALFPDKRRLHEQLDQVQSLLSTSQAQREALEGKKQRTGQFRNQAERDKHIRAEIESLQEQLGQHGQQAATVQEELKSVEHRETDIQSDLTNAAQQKREQAEEAQNRSRRKNELLEEQREIGRKQGKLKQALSALEADYQRSLPNNADFTAWQSVEAVKALAAELGLPVFGALHELFQVDPAFRTATDVIAGNSLFHVVVPDDTVAATLMQAMAKQGTGRVTFVPLNRITPPPADPADKINSESAVPLMSRIRPVDPIIQPALQQVFGKAVVVPDLKSGAQLARQYQVTAVTLSGDRADRKGALTGGWLDVTRASAGSRLAALARLSETKMRMDQCQQQLLSLDKALQVCKREYEGCVKATNAVLDTQALERELESVRRVKALKTKSLQEASLRVQAIRARIDCLSQELTAAFKEWSDKDESDLQQLIRTSADLEDERNKLEAAKSKLERQWHALEDELSLNFGKKRLYLLSQLAQAKCQLIPIASEMMIEAEWDEEGMNAQISSLEVSIKELEETLERCKQELYADGDAAGMEKYLSKRAAILQRKEECARKIRDLGLLTQADLQPYTSQSPSTLLSQLQTTQRALKAFGPVNKRALEQAGAFTRQGEALKKRQSELEESEGSIMEFIETLDRRKDEAIMRTFETVADNFAQIWRRLVPQGQAELIINTTSSVEGDLNEKENKSTKNTFKTKTNSKNFNVEFKGIGIKVSFQPGDNLLQSQLSGGQKSLVALALIFAIQACDPAPFYLFDEVDANLDTTYRQAVAEMLKSTPSKTGADGELGAQYVVTTFRPELVREADACWGVVCRDRVSGVVPITREDAMTFVVQTPQ